MRFDRVTVTQQYGDLQQEVFTFWLDDYTNTLMLDNYLFQVRQTKRHGWKTLQCWSRLNSRDNNIVREAIIIPEEIKTTVLQKFISKFKVEE